MSKGFCSFHVVPHGCSLRAGSFSNTAVVLCLQDPSQARIIDVHGTRQAEGGLRFSSAPCPCSGSLQQGAGALLAGALLSSLSPASSGLDVTQDCYASCWASWPPVLQCISLLVWFPLWTEGRARDIHLLSHLLSSTLPRTFLIHKCLTHDLKHLQNVSLCYVIELFLHY